MNTTFLVPGPAHGLPGRHIELEGLDGSGKGTQLDLLVPVLVRLFTNREVVLTHEPWDVPASPDGMRIRRILQHQEQEIDPGDGKIDPSKFQKIYVGDRYIHQVEEIRPRLKEGDIVVCDRGRLSTYGYGSAFGVPVEDIHRWHELIPIPDIIVFVDVPAEVCVERLKGGRDQLEYFESVEKLKPVREAYLKVHTLGILPTVVVDGTGAPEVVHKKVLAEVLHAIEGM